MPQGLEPYLFAEAWCRGLSLGLPISWDMVDG
jgi:hypothetical protein